MATKKTATRQRRTTKQTKVPTQKTPTSDARDVFVALLAAREKAKRPPTARKRAADQRKLAEVPAQKTKPLPRFVKRNGQMLSTGVDWGPPAADDREGQKALAYNIERFNKRFRLSATTPTPKPGTPTAIPKGRVRQKATRALTPRPVVSPSALDRLRNTPQPAVPSTPIPPQKRRTIKTPATVASRRRKKY